jgi:hypothetical protein
MAYQQINVPLAANANGMMMPQAMPPPMMPQTEFRPNSSNMPTGMNPSLALAFGAQAAGAPTSGITPNPQATSALQQAHTTNAATGLPSYFDPTWYVQNNPDVLAGFNSQKDKGEGIEWYGTQHYSNFAKGDGGQRYLGPQDPAYLARTQQGLSTASGTKPSDAQMAAYSAMSPEDQVNLINFLKGMGLA